jgi:hypothetical protein
MSRMIEHPKPEYLKPELPSPDTLNVLSQIEDLWNEATGEVPIKIEEITVHPKRNVYSSKTLELLGEGGRKVLGL